MTQLLMNFCFNYNEKKIEENVFLKKYRKIDKYKELEINKIIFKNIHSIQDDNLKFTNKIERANSPRINAIKNCISDLIESPENFNLYFDGDSINYKKETNDAWKLNRLDKILKLNSLIPNQDILYKYAPTINYQTIYNNHRGERGFQLIFTHNDNIINVYL